MRELYLLVCRACDEDADPADWTVHVFRSAALRGRWAALHTRGTGHYNWWCDELHGDDTGN